MATSPHFYPLTRAGRGTGRGRTRYGSGDEVRVGEPAAPNARRGSVRQRGLAPWAQHLQEHQAAQEPADPLTTLNNSSRMLYAQAKATALARKDPVLIVVGLQRWLVRGLLAGALTE